MEPFKNRLNSIAAKDISRAIIRAYPQFDQREFLRNIGEALEPLELKARSGLLKDRLISLLPPSPKKSFKILIKSIKQAPNDPIGLEGFKVWPLTQMISEQGLDDFEVSMEALYRMTQVFTAEFAIRPFLIHHEKLTLTRLKDWTLDPSEHVRRLVSEGSRPLLPWGEHLKNFAQDPELTWPLLEALRRDSSLYVRKSVANHCNDHSKNHGDWLVKKLKSWPHDAHEQWIVRHATRTLVKKGHKGALALNGIRPCKVEVLKQKLFAKNVAVGGGLEISLTIFNPTSRTARILIDQQVMFLKSNGLHKPKVFKGRTVNLTGGQKLEIQIKLPLKEITTRKYYSGRQYWAALINGQLYKPLPFNLTVPR